MSIWGVYLYSLFYSHKYLTEHAEQTDNSGKMKLLNMKTFKYPLKDPKVIKMSLTRILAVLHLVRMFS